MCQIGQGSDELKIEWSEDLSAEMDQLNLSQEKFLERIVHRFHEYKKYQVEKGLSTEIDEAIGVYLTKKNT